MSKKFVDVERDLASRNICPAVGSGTNALISESWFFLCIGVNKKKCGLTREHVVVLFDDRESHLPTKVLLCEEAFSRNIFWSPCVQPQYFSSSQ